MNETECKDCVSDNHSKVSSASTSNLSNITTTSVGSLELFETMIVQPIGHSILQLSSKHKILIISIKWFGCPMCQKLIDNLDEYLPSLLMLNIIPVICHQEDETKFGKHISHTKLFHCKISTQAKRMLLIDKASVVKHMKAMPTILKLLVKEKRKLFLPSLSEIKDMELVSTFGMHIVRNGQVETSYFYKNLLDRPDLGQFVFNLSNRKEETIQEEGDDKEMVISYKKSEIEEVEQFLPNLIKLYPDLKKVFSSIRQKRVQLPSSELSNNLQIGQPTSSTPTSPTLQVPQPANGGRPSTSSVGSSSSSISTSYISMSNVLENATMRTYFKAHLSNMYSLELVLFLEQVNIYKFLVKSLKSQSTCQNLLSSEEQILQDISLPASEMVTTIPEYETKARYIVETFLNDEAMFHINTSRKLTDRMKTLIEEKGFIEELFDEIEMDVKTSMLVYLFASFRQTTLFTEMMQRFKK
ncbi:RGS domain-containing protein [Naegleria gruberi]|uniref:RGS domain-containing protein n=1 Tax=Naegleria gruberi TaxID=5762 RepID=D2VWB4_NAEGR|nr:RGS domain-containing protein [Naegleria gruberi]EFC38805.1 RGS domain-containing protein [Naegleria gruberi]|eukprot:XP_002671549.1 RGS domain-containing protein [Naegleria gruberi strain NEG-M]